MELKNTEELLLELLLNLPGESGQEEPVRQFLLPQLTTRLHSVWQDDAGNLLGTRKFGNGPTVMLSAHMDVIYELAADSQLVKNGSIWSRSEGILGADDRAGIAMILILLDELPTQGFNGTIKVAFTVQEETGQKGAVKLDSSFYKDVKMAVSLDRRNGNDIVIRSNGSKTYGPEELGKLFETASKELWNGENNYIITNGGVSDLRVWSAEGVPSLNLSVGFRNEHTPYETLDIEEWRRTRQLVLHVLTTKKIGKFIFTQGENNVGV